MPQKLDILTVYVAGHHLKLNSVQALPADTDQWQSWLAENSRFRVQIERDVRCTYLLRHEKRGHRFYWIAYIRRGGRLFKQSTGADGLTADVLQAIWERFENQISLAKSGGLVVKEPRKSKRQYRHYSPTQIKVDEQQRYTRREAAELLGMSLAQFDYRVKVLGIEHVAVRRSPQTVEGAQYYPRREDPYLYSGADVTTIARYVRHGKETHAPN